MLLFNRIRDIITERGTRTFAPTFLPLKEQIECWNGANEKMDWGIRDVEFAKMTAAPPPMLTDDDRSCGFNGIAIFYGFGDDGLGNAESILSGKLD